MPKKGITLVPACPVCVPGQCQASDYSKEVASSQWPVASKKKATFDVELATGNWQPATALSNRTSPLWGRNEEEKKINKGE